MASGDEIIITTTNVSDPNETDLQEELDDEFDTDPYERHYHTISSPPCSSANKQLFGGHIPSSSAASSSSCHKSVIGFQWLSSSDQTKKKSKRPALNRLMTLRPPTHPLMLMRSNSTPSKHHPNSIFNSQNANNKIPLPSSLSNQKKASSPNRIHSKYFFHQNNYSDYFHCQFCGASTSPPSSTSSSSSSGSGSIYIDTFGKKSSPNQPSSPTSPRNPFGRSFSTETQYNLPQSSSKQTWNRRSVRYCKYKTKVLYHLFVCRFLVITLIRFLNFFFFTFRSTIIRL